MITAPLTPEDSQFIWIAAATKIQEIKMTAKVQGLNLTPEEKAEIGRLEDLMKRLEDIIGCHEQL